MKAGILAQLALVAALGLAGCRESPDVPPGSGPRVDPASLAGRYTLELWQLRPGMRLDAWASNSLGDQVSGPDTTGHWLDGWCARAVSVADVRGRTMQREAYFFPPAPPDSLELPDTAAADLARECTLGVMRLSAPAFDSASKGTAEADSLAATVGVAFGEPVASTSGFARSASWSRVFQFKRNDVVVFTAYDAPAAPIDSSAVRLIAIAFLPTAGLSEDGSPASDRFTPADTFPLDSALALARLDAALADTLLGIARQPSDPVRRDPRSLTRPLVRWISASAVLPAPRRAAALYAADVVLSEAMCRYALCERDADTLLAPLRAAGASFTWSPLGGSWSFDHAWMTRARVLDRDSPIGQRILLRQMAYAFDFSGVCGNGSDGFRSVIANGERYLERVPESPIAAEVHYFIAEAYRDIVALASGAAGDYRTESAVTAEEAPQARSMAVQHYQAAIAAAGPGRLAREAWKRAWWLMAGLPPADTRFFCVYD